MDKNAPPRDYPAEFRGRAEELRSIAVLVKDEHHRQTLLKCAEDYEKMAQEHELATVRRGTFKPRA